MKTIVAHDCVVAQARAAYQRAFAVEKAVLMLRSGLSVEKANMLAALMPEVVAAHQLLTSTEAQCPSSL